MSVLCCQLADRCKVWHYRSTHGKFCIFHAHWLAEGGLRYVRAYRNVDCPLEPHEVFCSLVCNTPDTE